MFDRPVKSSKYSFWIWLIWRESDSIQSLPTPAGQVAAVPAHLLWLGKQQQLLHSVSPHPGWASGRLCSAAVCPAGVGGDVGCGHRSNGSGASALLPLAPFYQE